MMKEKQYVFAIGKYVTIVVQANNIPNAWQYLRDLGIDETRASLLTH